MSRQPPFARALALGAAALLAAGGAGACSDSDERVTQGNVVQPGLPGEEASIVPPGTTLPPSEDPFTEADVTFLVQMVPHHAQALTMSELAATRAADPKVKAIAARIADVQQAEIDVYERWLSDHGMAPDGTPENKRGGDAHGDDHAADDHQEMPGMASPDELERLEAASGGEFDRLWLQLMIAHHEGALAMAAEREPAGTNQRVGELAADVVVTQTDEIATLREMLDRM